MTSGSQLNLLPGAVVSTSAILKETPLLGAWRGASVPVRQELPIVSELLQKLLPLSQPVLLPQGLASFSTQGLAVFKDYRWQSSP